MKDEEEAKQDVHDGFILSPVSGGVSKKKQKIEKSAQKWLTGV